jgi:hypothetical protein
MSKTLGRCLLVLSILIIQCHNSFAHHHDYEIASGEHAREADDHNVFSYTDFEEHYTSPDENSSDCFLPVLIGEFLETNVAQIEQLLAVDQILFFSEPDISCKSLRAPPSLC